ncbi:MAG: hypothetical protein M0R03_16695 [Novosphingobium sp.]|nr:hypothetical protein [Novosphingobium sp.]
MPIIKFDVAPLSVLSLIVDGESLSRRAYHAFTRKDFIKQTKQGYYNGCFWGFFSWLKKRYQHYQPEELIVCWGDRKENLKRLEFFPSYKKSRFVETIPVALNEQVRDIQLALNLLGIKQYYSPGYEGDDVIAANIPKFFLKSNQIANTINKKIFIISQDKDLLQLVNKYIEVIQLTTGNTGKDLIFDESATEKKFGIPASLISDYLTLIGDSGDDVPNIPSVGPKTAIMLLKKFGPISDWFDKIDDLDITLTLKQTLLTHKKQMIINKKLVCLSLYSDIPLVPVPVVKDSISIEDLFKTYELVDVFPHEFLFFD